MKDGLMQDKLMQDKLQDDGLHIYVIGGGAAGIMAAIAAAGGGARVTVLEKTDRPGRKLSITGNGRCNLTTLDNPKVAAEKFGPNGKFLRGVFAKFFSAELLQLMGDLRVPVARVEGRGYYPRSGRAADVTSALLKKAEELGVEVRVNSPVDRIVIEDGAVAGLEVRGEVVPARRVILATGGASYPATGSTGDGYRIAGEVGHSIVQPLPSVVPLLLEGELHAALAPLTFESVRAALLLDGKVLRESEGGILFTPWGATGPAALALSKYAAANMVAGKSAGAISCKDEDAGKGDDFGAGNLALRVNFIPHITAAEFDKSLVEKFKAGGIRTVGNIFGDYFPRRAAVAFAARTGLHEFRTASQVTAAERKIIVETFTACKFKVVGTRPLEEAMVTAGGVSLKEINPKTMESRIARGLYICGELLDLDAGTGGYNLQAAFSTGRAAGLAAAGEA